MSFTFYIYFVIQVGICMLLYMYKLNKDVNFDCFFFLFILAINRPDITDTEMETVMDTIVDSLFCFFVTLGMLFKPICSFKVTNHLTHLEMLYTTIIIIIKDRVSCSSGCTGTQFVDHACLELTGDQPGSASPILRLKYILLHWATILF